MLDARKLLPGEEQYEYYTCRVTKKHHCQYDYRADDGCLFSCVKPNLEACRAARDEWAANRKQL